MEIVYLNGEYVAKSDAKISVFDRGILFADSIYEVTCAVNGKLIDFDRHATRLESSLKELGIPSQLSKEELLSLHRELVAQNNLENGYVYVQVTRGTDTVRDFAHPDPKKTPATVFAFTTVLPDFQNDPLAQRGLKVVSRPDLRWGRRDIKTAQLLYSSMAKMEAVAAGADDAWLVEDGYVTEGTAHNAFIIKDNEIITRALSTSLLPGTMRAATVEFARANGLALTERPFTVAEVLDADEAFATGSGHIVMSVVEIDGQPIGSGKPGPLGQSLRQSLLETLTRT